MVAPNPSTGSTGTAGRTHRAGLQAAGALPAWGAAAGPALGVTGSPVATLTAPVASGTPSAGGTWHGAVRSVPACGMRGQQGGHGDGDRGTPPTLVCTHLPCRGRSRRGGSRQGHAGRSNAPSSSSQRCQGGTRRSSARPGGGGRRLQDSWDPHPGLRKGPRSLGTPRPLPISPLGILVLEGEWVTPKTPSHHGNPKLSPRLP